MLHFAEVIHHLNSVVWGLGTQLFLVGTGAYLTVRTGFRPWRYLGRAMGQIFAPAAQSGLEEALAKLSLQQRALLHLYYFEGYQSEEIAAMMDSKPAAVRAQLQRIRAKLKDYITEGEDEIV